MTNRASLFAQYIQSYSSTIMVMMFSMNPSIDAFVAVMSNSKVYAVAIWLADFFFSYCVSKYRCGKFRSYVSQDSSHSRSFPRSIDVSLTVVYSFCAGVVSKSKLRQRKASLSTTAMHVDTVVAFACIQRWAASQSVFPINQVWSDSCCTRLCTDSPEGPGNEQSCVTRLLI